MSAWVLLRGLTRESGHWDEFPDALAAAFPRDDFVCLDLPGTGSRHDQRSPRTVPAIAAACRAALQARGVAPPYLLFALSLGAMVAVEWSTLHPQEVEGAVLINTSLRRFSAWHRRLRLANARPLLTMLTARDAEAAERCVLAMTTRHPKADAETTVGGWAAIRRARPVSAGNAMRQLWAAASYSAPTLAPPVPLLVLASDGDGLVDPACSRRIAAAWHADLAVHESAGHDLPLDDPAWVIAEVARWRSLRLPSVSGPENAFGSAPEDR